MVGSIRSVLKALVLVGLVGCTAPNPRVCQDGFCPDPAFPFCDVDGSFEGNSNACISVSCTPMEFASCRGDEEVACNADGSNYEIQTCGLGCDDTLGGCNQCAPGTSTCNGDMLLTCGSDGRATSSEACSMGCEEGPTPHCAHIVPRYLPDVCDVPAPTGSLVISTSSTFDTGLDSNCNGGVVPQTAAPSICVVRYSDFTIAAGVTLTAISGTDLFAGGGRPLAIVADGALNIHGVLDVSGTYSASGPGGGTVQAGGMVTSTTAQGGAGFKTAGAPGGSSTAAGGAMNGGAAATNPALLNALIGGHRSSGGGGGAVMLVSCRANVSVTGMVDAGGGGGLAFLSSGGGGGAGGNVVMQGIDVAVTGDVFANGGGGGGGKASGQAGAANGEDGVRDTAYSAQGGNPSPGGGRGGTGGRYLEAAGGGLAPTAAGGYPGGGGGGIGFFQSYTPAGVLPVLTPTRASPPFEPNGTIPTR